MKKKCLISALLLSVTMGSMPATAYAAEIKTVRLQQRFAGPGGDIQRER